MSTEYTPPTRDPARVGYLSWLLHRLSALALVPLLAIHVGVQVYPQYGFDAIYQYNIYQPLLSLTLGIVLLHAFLGVRATTLETRLSSRLKTVIIWLVGLFVLSLFVYRLVG
ncbi:hypothetical protein ACFOZ7_15580 [Natribaculum luteum]|uniref:Succinate dehydrogenase n=1 Tax=Natribaculum luteum TaxID=1586232 RepID=A0ABD5P2T9_9EURY|nr:hypothetical protein [Natribaculum luteum]